MKKYFSLDEVGEVSEYVGCKVEYNKEEGYMKLTQPVLIQSFRDEFELPEIEYKTPAAPNESLVEGPVLEEKIVQKGSGKINSSFEIFKTRFAKRRTRIDEIRK